MILCCTAKLLKEMGVTRQEVVEELQDNSTLGEWYANMFYVERKKCLIFINARTLFSFVIFDVKRQAIRDIGMLFRMGLGRSLLGEDFDGTLIQRLVEEGKNIQLAKTRDRRVLGIMVENTKQAKWMLDDEGGLAHNKDSAVTRYLNRIPLVHQEFTFAIEALKNYFDMTVSMAEIRDFLLGK